MPKVGKMRFPYTDRGMKDAQAYSSNTGKSIEIKKYRYGGRVSPSMGPRGPRGSMSQESPMGPRNSMSPRGPRGQGGPRRPLFRGAQGGNLSKQAQQMQNLKSILSLYRNGGKVKKY